MVTKSWLAQSINRGVSGVFRIRMGKPSRDVTYFRNGLTQLQSYASADPFDDATCELVFPQVTALDDFGHGELKFMHEFSPVDIYFVDPDAPVFNNATKVWEGHVISLEPSISETGGSVTLQCQGALFQLDHYVQLTTYLLRPVDMEKMIKEAFSHARRPHLRTQPLKVVFPNSWSTKNARGQKITGFKSRDTGTNGQRPLTGWIQTSLLPLMQKGDQGAFQRWTMMKQMGRRPVLQLRDIALTDYTIYAGIPGVTMQVTRDGSEIVKVIYGQGTDLGGTDWHRFRIAPDGSRTDYEPLYGDPTAYPIGPTNKRLDLSSFRTENYTDYGSGFDEDDAITDAKKLVNRDKDPGYTGTITLKIDPLQCSRFLMRAGKNIRVKYFAGTGDEGMLFHIAQCTVSPEESSVELTVDTKFRDLLTLEEVIARSRDSHTPSRLLRAGAQSQFFHDIYQPWSYSSGCGFISAFRKEPDAKYLYLKKAKGTDVFPYVSMLERFPPRRYPEYYVAVRAGATDSRQRWSRAQVLVNHAGTIRRTEFICVDRNGNPRKIPFHVSVYSDPVGYESMPMHNGVVSPFLAGAFVQDQSNPNFNVYEQPTQSFITGWGDGDQKAGFWPGLQSRGSPVSGRLVEEGGWNYDLTTQFSPNRPKRALRTLHLMFYADTTALGGDTVYFTGRLYRGIEDLPL